MLVLSRQREEAVIIGDEIAIRVLEIRGDKVRLGITAPCEMSVHREEVWKTINGSLPAPDRAEKASV